MKVSVIIEETCEDTGETISTTSYSYNNIDDLYTWMWFLSEATRKAGFTYVDAVGVQKDDKTQMWITF